jgi:hypothetical protein
MRDNGDLNIMETSLFITKNLERICWTHCALGYNEMSLTWHALDLSRSLNREVDLVSCERVFLGDFSIISWLLADAQQHTILSRGMISRSVALMERMYHRAKSRPRPVELSGPSSTEHTY